MDTTLVRPSSTPTIEVPEGPKDNTNVSGHDSEAPIEVYEEGGHDIVLEALGIEGSAREMPSEDQANAKEVKQYVLDIINKSGDSPTMGAFKRTLNDIKTDMGLSEDSDPTTVLDRIGSVIKAWKQLSFIRDTHQKRSIFMKMAKANSSSEINKIVMDAMEAYHVWK